MATLYDELISGRYFNPPSTIAARQAATMLTLEQLRQNAEQARLAQAGTQQQQLEQLRNSGELARAELTGKYTVEAHRAYAKEMADRVAQQVRLQGMYQDKKDREEVGVRPMKPDETIDQYLKDTEGEYIDKREEMAKQLGAELKRTTQGTIDLDQKVQDIREEELRNASTSARRAASEKLKASLLQSKAVRDPTKQRIIAGKMTPEDALREIAQADPGTFALLQPEYETALRDAAYAYEQQADKDIAARLRPLEAQRGRLALQERTLMGEFQSKHPYIQSKARAYASEPMAPSAAPRLPPLPGTSELYPSQMDFRTLGAPENPPGPETAGLAMPAPRQDRVPALNTELNRGPLVPAINATVDYLGSLPERYMSNLTGALNTAKSVGSYAPSNVYNWLVRGQYQPTQDLAYLYQNPNLVAQAAKELVAAPVQSVSNQVAPWLRNVAVQQFAPWIGGRMLSPLIQSSWQPPQP